MEEQEENEEVYTGLLDRRGRPVFRPNPKYQRKRPIGFGRDKE